MLDYNNNNKDWTIYKLSKLGIYNTIDANKLISSYNREEINEAVKVLEQRDDIYKDGYTYYQFQKHELSNDDKTFIDLKVLDEIQNINENNKILIQNINDNNKILIDNINKINHNSYVTKNCMIFFVVLVLISIVITLYSSFKTAKMLNDSIYSYQQEYQQNYSI